jgi:hypothetical protein
MRFAFLSALAVLAVACNSSVSTGGDGGGGASSTSTTGAASSSTGGDTCASPSDPIAFEAGSGEACFERLTTGQTVTVLQGPQGGYHVWLAVGCVGCSGKTTIEFGVKDPATKTWFATTSPQKVSVDLGGAGWQQQAGFTAFLPGVVWDEKSSLPKGTHVLLTTIHYAADGISSEEIQHEIVLGDIEQYNPPCDQNPMTCGTPGGQPCCGLGN